VTCGPLARLGPHHRPWSSVSPALIPAGGQHIILFRGRKPHSMTSRWKVPPPGLSVSEAYITPRLLSHPPLRWDISVGATSLFFPRRQAGGGWFNPGGQEELSSLHSCRRINSCHSSNNNNNSNNNPPYKVLDRGCLPHTGADSGSIKSSHLFIYFVRLVLSLFSYADVQKLVRPMKKGKFKIFTLFILQNFRTGQFIGTLVPSKLQD